MYAQFPVLWLQYKIYIQSAVSLFLPDALLDQCDDGVGGIFDLAVLHGVDVRLSGEVQLVNFFCQCDGCEVIFVGNHGKALRFEAFSI